MQVLELPNPVEDEKGYIYDRDAITAHIRTSGGRCEAPFSGEPGCKQRSRQPRPCNCLIT